MRKNVLMMFAVCFMAASQLFAAVPTLTGGAGVLGSTKVGPAGSNISINGTGLTGTTIVKLGGVDVASYTVVSDIRIDAVVSANGNSGLIYVQNADGNVTSNYPFTYTPTVLNPLAEGDVVINKIYNANDTDGSGDAVEILVVKDDADLRGLYFKDWQPNKNGGLLTFFFREIPLFEHVRAGTLIVVRNSATTADADKSDFTMDLGLQDLNYFFAGNASANPAHHFDVAGGDMMSLQKGASGATGIIAVLGNGPVINKLPPPNGAVTSSFPISLYTRLNNATTLTAGNFIYVTNATSTLDDYKHAETGGTASTYDEAENSSKTVSNVTMNEDGTPAALVLGMPNNATNATYIANLRVIGSTVLPVNLISFTAKATTNGVAINWATASEQNNNRFEIRRSADGNSFVTIKTVTGANSANSRNNYSFTDKNSLTGVNYYKLVQIDNDGTVKELGVQAVSSDASGLNFSVASNNVANQVNYTVNATVAGNATIKIFNTSGAQIASSNVVLVAGNNSLKLNVSSLTSGVYVAVLTAENQTLTSKFVK